MADTILSQNEIDYLNTQRIARIATVSIISDRPIQPDVVPFVALISMASIYM